MKKIFISIIFLIICRLFCLSLSQNFKLINIIGNDQSDSNFFYISDAIITPCRDIIILDAKENFVARFDWEGKLINRIGQKGQGPGDFYWPTSASILNDKLYFLDRFNNRFVESNLELKNLHYFKLQENRMPKYFHVISKNKFVIDNTSFVQPDGPRIFIIEKIGKANPKISKMFFKHTPIDINLENKDDRTLYKFGSLFKVIYGIDDTRKKMLISFCSPNNPIVFFLYNIKGEFIKKFSYQTDKKYNFPHYLYKRKKLSFSSLRGQNVLDLASIFYYDSHWYVFVNTSHYENRNFKNIREVKKYTEKKSFYLKFDENGKLVGKFIVDPFFRCFHISKDGYVLGKHPDSEVERLVVYKILN